MLRSFLVLSIFTLLTFVVGCGSNPEESSISSVTSQRTPLLIAIGGRSSCDYSDRSQGLSPYGLRMFPNLEKLISKLSEQFNADPKYIATCYDFDGIAVVSSWDEEVIYGLSDENVIQLLTEKKAEIGASKTIIAGHSYGGWLAMQFVLSQSVEESKNQSIYTIDPISRVNCTFSFPINCLTSPSDITTKDRKEISAKSDNWINFWQDRTFYLHADPISQADLNIKIDSSHITIPNDETVWKKIEDTFTTYFLQI